ncbi:hypothetical protein D3C81_1354560 [compost metagenome]
MRVAVDDQRRIAAGLSGLDGLDVPLRRVRRAQPHDVEVGQVGVQRGAFVLGIDYRDRAAQADGQLQRGIGLA